MGATEDTKVRRREQSLRKDVRTQKKVREGPCWSELDEHRVLVSGRTGGLVDAAGSEKGMCGTQERKQRWRAGSCPERGDHRNHEMPEAETGGGMVGMSA